MTIIKRNKVIPVQAIHSLLYEILERRELSSQDEIKMIADKMAQGELPFSNELANRLSILTDVSEGFWKNRHAAILEFEAQ